MAQAILLLGGNMGDTRALLQVAAERLTASGVEIVQSSAMIETEPWGFESTETNRFVNQALEVHTLLTPHELLDATQRAENEVGRARNEEALERAVRGEKYASRKIDIDIIFYDDCTLKSDRLTLPHPLMQDRDFVLRPIVEIAPAWPHPTIGKSCRELLNDLTRGDK